MAMDRSFFSACRRPSSASYGALAIAAALCCATASAEPLAGTFSSPIGSLAITEKDGAVIGKIAGKNPCGFAKGFVALEGSRLDDSVVGTIKACKVGAPECTGGVDGAAMLLITKKGNVMSGAVHLEAGACKTPLNGDAIVLKKGGAGKTAAPPDKKVDKQVDKKKGSPRERAEKLAAEGKAILEGAESNAEAARAKFQEAVEVDPSYGEGYIGVGVSFFVRERYDEALDFYKRALEANPALGDAYYNTACVYAVKGDKEQALRYLRIAVLNGYVQLNTFAEDPDLKSLQGDPTFEKLKSGQAD